MNIFSSLDHFLFFIFLVVLDYFVQDLQYQTDDRDLLGHNRAPAGHRTFTVFNSGPFEVITIIIPVPQGNFYYYYYYYYNNNNNNNENNNNVNVKVS